MEERNFENEKSLSYQWQHGSEELYLQVGWYYANQGLAISLISIEEGNPSDFGNLTVNLPYYDCEVNEAYIDAFSSKDKLAFIRKHKLGKVLDETASSGMQVYSKVAFNLDQLAKYDPEGVRKYRELKCREGEENV